MENIPYGRQTIEQDDLDGVSKILTSNLITTGPVTKQFEDRLVSYTNANYCIAVSNGTVALHLASLVLLNSEDRVLTTPNSFLATSNSILYVGAKPIFVDIAQDGNIDLDLCEIELKNDPTIKAIYAVAFSGNMINQKKLKYLKETYKIIILEDNAHAIGTEYDGIKAGSCTNSDMSIFSFHPVKHMTTGEGGAITTNNRVFYEKLLILRNHGITKRDGLKPWEYEMIDLGINGRITDFQCALGLSQLNKLDTFIDTRVKIAKRYDEAFKGTIIKPLYIYDGKSSYHLYVVRIDFSRLKITKLKLFERLKQKNIILQIHYMPINKQPYYKALGYGDENTPNMDKYYKECFSLPIYPLLSDEEQDYVIKTLGTILDV